MLHLDSRYRCHTLTKIKFRKCDKVSLLGSVLFMTALGAKDVAAEQRLVLNLCGVFTGLFT